MSRRMTKWFIVAIAILGLLAGALIVVDYNLHQQEQAAWQDIQDN